MACQRKNEFPIPSPICRRCVFLKPNLERCLHLGQTLLSGLGLPGCDCLSWDSRGVCVGGYSPRFSAGGPLVGRSPCLQRRGPSSRRGKPSGAKATKAGGEGYGERGQTKAPASASPHARSDRELFPWPPNFHSSPGEGGGWGEAGVFGDRKSVV